MNWIAVVFLFLTLHAFPGVAHGQGLLLFYSSDVHGETEPCG